MNESLSSRPGAAIARLDRRLTKYRFDLESDIPWHRLLEPGLFAGSQLLAKLGVVPEYCDSPPEELQWVFAATTARAFVALEGDVCDFVSTEGTSVPSRSAALLVEEEHKHRALFHRLAEHIMALRPDWAAELSQVWTPPVSWADVATANHVAVPEHRHWLIWLATLFFEEYTIWIHHALAADPAHIQPTWLLAHACHAREEAQHVLTDEAYLDLLPVSEADRVRLARGFQLFLEENLDRVLCLNVVQAFMQRRGMDVFGSRRSWDSLPLRSELAHHAAFARTRRHMPALDRKREGHGLIQSSPSDNLVDCLRAAHGSIVFAHRDGETRWSTDELYERARRRLAGLRVRGLGAGDVVLITAKGPENFLTTYWACLLGGILPAPLDANHDRIEAVRQVLEPALVVDDAEAHTLDGDSTPLVQPGEVAVLQFTSGSTSTPRGVRLTHANVLADVRGMAAHRHGSRTDTFVSWLPMFHDMGLIGYHLAPIALGANQVLLTPEQFAKNPMSWIRALDRHRGTVTGGPASALSHLLKWAGRRDISDLDLSQVHCWLVGAEPISIAVLEEASRVLASAKLPATALCPGYGLAEASLAVTMTPRETARAWRVDPLSLGVGEKVEEARADHPRAVALVDCGSPISGVGVRITHQGCVVPSGVVGRIEVTGPTVGGDPPPAWLETGDLGVLRGGRLFVTGREKDAFFVDGRTYYAHDIERVALEHDDVRPHGAALVVSPPDHHGVERRTLFVAPVNTPDTPSTLARIARHVAERTGISLHQVVAVGRGDLPRTTSGKIRRHTLNDLDGQGRFADAPRWKPPGGTEADGTLALVRGIWAAALDLPVQCVGPDDDFFSLGGRSLIAADILGRLEEALGRQLSVQLLRQGDTPQKMAAWLDHAATTQEPIVTAPSRRALSPAAKTAPSTEVPSQTALPIAVVGIALRLPSADDPAGFWHILREGRCLIADVPPERFDAAAFLAQARGVTHVSGAFLGDVTRFDPEPFGMNDEVAKALDPQQRLFLEVAHDALGQALVPLDRVGVFVAAGDNEYALRYLAAPELAGPNALLGALKNMIAARVSSVFGLTGPSMTVDTACSSSLAAVHLAVRSLRSGECDVALAGGVQINLTDQAWRYFAGARLLSTDGVCRPFDGRASGLVPGEGAIGVVLKPLSAAVGDRDTIWGVIRGTAMTNDGGAVSGTAPNPRGQRESIERAWADAGLDPSTATYVEAHAAGTALGDALEVESLLQVFARAPSVLVGAVKSNLGHTLAVSGIAGLVKVLLSLKHEALPPTLGCQEPAARIPFSRSLAPCAVLTSWSRGDHPRRAGVDSFGLGGTNVHVVLEEAPFSAPALPAPVPTVVPVAAPAGTLSRVAACQRKAEGHLASRAAAAIRRARWGTDRAAVVVASEQALDAALAELAPSNRFVHRVAFVIPGPGSQVADMGKALSAREPIFAEAWVKCRAAFAAHGLDLDVSVSPGSVDRIESAQPAVFSFAYASALWLASLDLEAAAMLGHSAGEILAAHLAGVLSFDDAVSLIVARGNAMASAPRGGLVAVFAPESAVRGVIDAHALPLTISAWNAPNQTVVAGARESLEEARACFEASGLPARILLVGTPAHSPRMASVAEALARALLRMELHEPSRPWISTRTGLPMGRPDPHHFARQIMEPVRFVAAVEAALAAGIDGFVELGASAGLTACVQAIAQDRALALSIGQRDESEHVGALHVVAALWSAGMNLRLDRLAGASEPALRLPAWPWSRRRLWIDAPEVHASLGPRELVLTGGDIASIADHCTSGRSTAPAALLIDYLLASRRESPAGLRRVVVEHPLLLASGERRVLVVNDSADSLTLSTRPVHGQEATVHLRAELESHPRRTFDRVDLMEIRRRCPREASTREVYELLRATRFDVGPRLRGARRIHIGEGELVVELETPTGGDRGQFFDPALLDGASQAVAALFLGERAAPSPYLGFSIGSVAVWAPVRQKAVAVVQLRSRVDAETTVLRHDILFCDPDGKLLAEVRDFSAKRAESTFSTPSHSAPTGDGDLLAQLLNEVAARVRRPASAISPDAGLARVGLDSLKAVELVAALEARYGVALPATLLFEVRSLREAAQVLRDHIRGARA